MNIAFNSIKRGLLEAIEHAETVTTTEVTLWLHADVVDKLKQTGRAGRPVSMQCCVMPWRMV